MITLLISPWDYEHFFKSWKKLLDFKKRTGFTRRQIRNKSGASESAIRRIFRGDEPEPTETYQKNMDMIIKAYHLSPDWINGKSQKMFLDFEALSEAEIEKVKRNKKR